MVILIQNSRYLKLRDLLRHTVAVRNGITHLNFPREIYVPFGILIQPVKEKFPRPIKLEQTGISADKRETTRTKMAQVHGLDLKIIIVLWSSRIYLRLVHSLIFSVDAFFLVYKHAKFGDFFRFHGSPFSGSTRSRETLLQEADKYGEQAIKQFVSELLRIRSHESNTKRLGIKIFLCPITDKDFNWLRVESQGSSFLLVNLAVSTSSRPNKLPLGLRGWECRTFGSNWPTLKLEEIFARACPKPKLENYESEDHRLQCFRIRK